jgi:hypothetical protein
METTLSDSPDATCSLSSVEELSPSLLELPYQIQGLVLN